MPSRSPLSAGSSSYSPLKRVTLVPPDLGDSTSRELLVSSVLREGTPLQRLFSMFPNGWPGRGLLILRLFAGAFQIQAGINALIGSPHRGPIALLLIPAAAGILLLLGLWTPVAGLVSAFTELLALVFGIDEPRSTLLLIAIGVSIAMLGPGNWSIDALLFGRRRLDLHRR
jgi:putative oxidoreductase